MKEIRTTEIFEKWFAKLKDDRAVACISDRIRRLATGNAGDSRFFGDVSEMRIDYGPGYRVYFKDTGRKIIILLCGGNKSTQQADIEKARKIASHF